MVKLEDPTVRSLVSWRGGVANEPPPMRSHSGSGRQVAIWQAIYSEPDVKAVVGATHRALDTDQAEHTLQIIGAMGGVAGGPGIPGVSGKRAHRGHNSSVGARMGGRGRYAR